MRVPLFYTTNVNLNCWGEAVYEGAANDQLVFGIWGVGLMPGDKLHWLIKEWNQLSTLFQ